MAIEQSENAATDTQKELMLYIAYAAALAVMGLIAGVGYYWKKQQSVEISDSYGPALG